MPTFEDAEFGTVTVRRSANARYVRIRVAPNGTLRASLPLYSPVYMVKRLLKESRDDIRELLKEHNGGQQYLPGMQIGKSHSLLLNSVVSKQTSVTRTGLQIRVTLGENDAIEDLTVQAKIREVVIQALRREAKGYLPKRLAYLANQHDYSYNKLRFSHASGRWGSCSSNGTISLNIALMKLPFELIDYVLVHELSHTVEMNHSQDFWRRVERADPHYARHKQALQRETPSI